MKTTRRLFLKSGALALASVGLAPAFGPDFLRQTLWAAEPKKRKVLVCVFMRGAVDGMSLLVPHGDPFYYQLRKTGPGGIAIPNSGEGKLLDLDGFFGLHPALAPLLPFYQNGMLAPIHAVGSPNPTRSHFDAQDYMESGAPGNKSISTGWLSRALQACPEDAARAARIRAVAMSAQLPRSFGGDADALAIANLANFGVGKNLGAPKRMAKMPGMAAQNGAMGSANGGFEALYQNAVGDVLHGAGTETFEALKLLSGLDPAKYQPQNGADYGRGKLGESLRQIAQMIKADIGLQIAFAEVGGWDTHVAQGGSQGNLARRLGEVGTALSGFARDMGDEMENVVVLTMSEFGRTARQNGDGGTDHGHGTAFLALGGPVKGGKVLAKWPGLAPEQLYENRDLAVTTDFRGVFSEVVRGHLGVPNAESLFPEFAGKGEKLGLV